MPAPDVLTTQPSQADLIAIGDLQYLVHAIDDEFSFAQQLQEAWKPMAYDRALQIRVENGAITGPFLTIRYALRREMLLALMRIWDKPDKTLRMLDVVKKLERPGVIAELVRRRVSQHDGQWIDDHAWELVPAAQQEGFRQDLQERERRFGRSQGEKLRKIVMRSARIIRSYDTGGRHEELQHLRDLRNGRLAHRRTSPSGKPGAGEQPVEQTEKAVQRLYRATLTLVRLLNNLSLDVDYDPADTGRIRAESAALFWDALRPVEWPPHGLLDGEDR